MHGVVINGSVVNVLEHDADLLHLVLEGVKFVRRITCRCCSYRFTR